MKDSIKAMESAKVSKDVRAPKDTLRNFLRWLYFPWVWLVYVPFLLVSTIFFGILAATTCFISKRIAFHCGTAWALLLCLVNFTWVPVKGRKNIQKGQSYVIMCNHQSHFDVLAFYGYWFRQFRWVIKQELRKVPGLGWGCEGVGHIFIDRANRQKAIESLEAARPLLKGGISVLFFPEGTRSNDGRMLPFKKGGFMMALQLGLPILPVTISDSGHVLPNRTFKLLPGIIRIQVHEPIDISSYTIESRDQLMADVRKVIGSGLKPSQRDET